MKTKSCNLVGAYEHKIYEDTFGGCKKSFSWHAMPMTPARICPPDDAASRQDISTPSSILIEFETTEYSYSIRYSIRIRNVEDIRFDIRYE